MVKAQGQGPAKGEKQGPEWDKAGQFCFGVGPEAWGVVRQTRLAFGNSGCAEWALSLPWGLLHAPAHHPQVPTRCSMIWNRQNGHIGWTRKCKSFGSRSSSSRKGVNLTFGIQTHSGGSFQLILVTMIPTGAQPACSASLGKIWTGPHA